MFLHLSVILFTWAWADTPPGQTPPSRHPPPADTPPADTPPAQCMLGYDQQVGGTHPTEMQSCFSLQVDNPVSLQM